MAQGWGGQWIVVWPEMNMIIVSTGGNYYSDPLVPIQAMLVDYILPAVEAQRIPGNGHFSVSVFTSGTAGAAKGAAAASRGLRSLNSPQQGEER